MKPNSMSTLGIALARSTRKPAWCTPLSTRLQVPRNCSCISEARRTLCAMYLSCMNSKMMYDSAELGLNPA